MSSIYDVRTFHEKFKLSDARLDRPGFLPEDLQRVRLNFLLEELVEIAWACGFCLAVGQGGSVEFMRDRELDDRLNLAEAFDGLLDLVYVALGTADLMGFGNSTNAPGYQSSIWWEGWRRVQRANMSKVLVASADESKRGTKWDVKKPRGWKAPYLQDLLI
jgi:predicted HAD superfamily Cof-like phosphohydrolase